MGSRHGVEQKEVPSLWDAARQEMEGYGFLGNYEQPKEDVPAKIGISCAVSDRFSDDADRGHAVSSIERYIDRGDRGGRVSGPYRFHLGYR